MKRSVVFIAAIVVALMVAPLAYDQWRQNRSTEVATDLIGKRVIVLLADQFNPLEYNEPLIYLRKRGAEVLNAGLTNKEVSALRSSTPYSVDLALADLSADDIDCLVIPGGLCHPALIADERVGDLIRALYESGKIVAANGNSTLVLGKAGILKGKTVTVWPDSAEELRQLAASVKADQAVVTDGNVVTSRGPADAHGFAVAIAEALLAGQ